jgi:hypothetical protein
VPDTGGTEYGSREGWPTATAQDGKNNAGPSQWRRHTIPLNVAVQRARFFPTPRAVDSMTRTHADSDPHHVRLNAEVHRMFDTPTTHGDGGSGRKGNVPPYAQLNPEWVEWLMGWPVGWTDCERNEPGPWLDISIDPAEHPSEDGARIPRVTDRREGRAARIRALGNGQVPLCAAIAFEEGLCRLGWRLDGQCAMQNAE